MYSFLSSFWTRDPVDREWEAGRREGFKAFAKEEDYYLKAGVRASEAYIQNSRNVEIFTKEWRPLTGEIKGLVFYCHGYGDSCHYFFDDVAVRLAQNSYAVFGMDYEGHGRSQGLHVYIPRFDTIVDDVIEYYESIKEREEFKGLASFLYGESMGGAVALKVHLRQPSAWTGLILMAPMCRIGDEMLPSDVLMFLLKRFAYIFPKKKGVPTADMLEIGFREPDKREIARKNPAAYLHPPRLATALQLLNVTQELEAQMEKVSVPLLILHGAVDKVTDPKISEELHKRSNGPSTLKLYPDSCHCLIAGEPRDVVEQVYGDIFMWLDSMIKGYNSQTAKE